MSPGLPAHAATVRPDGIDSARAWRVAAWSAVALVLSFGVAYSFGALLPWLHRDLGLGTSHTAWMFSGATFLFLVLSGRSGRWADRHGPRGSVACGGLLLGAGLLGLTAGPGPSLAPALYALPVGAGLALVYVPVLSNVGAWFHQHRSRAVGLVAASVGLGTLLGAPSLSWAIAHVGWRPAVAGAGVLLAVGLPVLAQGLPPAPRTAGMAAAGGRPGLPRHRREFHLMYAAGVGFGFALYMPLLYLVPQAIEGGSTPMQAAGLLSVIGAASVGARLLLGALARGPSSLPAYKASYALVLLAYAAWITSPTFAGRLAGALMLGLGYGGITALTPVLVFGYFDAGNAGARIGSLTASGAFGALLGAPLASSLSAATGARSAWMVFAVIAAASTVAAASLRHAPPSPINDRH